VRLAADRGRRLATRLADPLLRVLPAERLERPRDDDGLALERTGCRGRCPWRRELGLDARFGKILEDVLTAIRDPPGKSRRDERSDALELLEPGGVVASSIAEEPGRPRQPAVAAGHWLVLPGREPADQPWRDLDRRRPADLGDTESGDDSLERSAPRALDGAV